MKVYRTASMTAVWRNMAGIDEDSIIHVNLLMRFFAYTMGKLDPNSVATIAERTKKIDFIIKKSNPKCIVEIGAGFSSRSGRFKNTKFYEMDLPHFKKFKKNIIKFDIGKDELKLDIKNALFIVEGVTMYLQKEQVLALLSQIKKYKGSILIDFFNKEYSAKKKSLREKIYKALFRLIIGSTRLFDFRIENIQEGIALLKASGYENIKFHKYKIPKTLDVLFFAQL